MVDNGLYDVLQRKAAVGVGASFSPTDVVELARELAAYRALQAREDELVAALSAVQFVAVGRTATAPACPLCGAAAGVGHQAACRVGTALGSR
jgi:hypothetical protein